jgi:cell division protein ZapA
LTKSLEVEIYGQVYTVKAEAEEAYMRRVAAYVDEQMRMLAGRMKTATPTKLAVLTALNLAHQLFQAEQGGADIDRRAQCLMDSIEEQLQATRRS